MSKIRLIDELYMGADSVQYTLVACGTREKIDLKTKKGTGEMTDYEKNKTSGAIPLALDGG